MISTPSTVITVCGGVVYNPLTKWSRCCQIRVIALLSCLKSVVISFCVCLRVFVSFSLFLHPCLSLLGAVLRLLGFVETSYFSLCLSIFTSVTVCLCFCLSLSYSIVFCLSFLIYLSFFPFTSIFLLLNLSISSFIRSDSGSCFYDTAT